MSAVLPVRLVIRRRRSWLQAWELWTPAGRVGGADLAAGDFARCRLRRRR